MSNVIPIRHASDAALDVLPDARTLPAALPTPLTSFIGRDAEMRDVLSLLDGGETRLLTLMGPGGVGKTRLSIEAASSVERDFADGTLYLRLASIRDPDLVLPALGQLVGVREREGLSLFGSIVTAFRDRHMLLVLDNFEHLLAEAPTWLVDLLGACPRIVVLVTSRIALNIDGEQRYVVRPLPIPASDDVGEASETAAVRLFVQRAGAVRLDFTLTAANRESVVDICRRLEGLPLAIELAAAKVNVFTPDQIRSRLSDQFRLLTSGRRDVTGRQQSMRDTIAWSYELLAPDEQALFRQLSVFVGGFTLDAAERVSETPGLDTVDGVASLVDQSLLRAISEDNAEPRYLMLETIREFGLEWLSAGDDVEAVRNRHADWCLALASKATRFDPTGQLPWLQGLGAEYGNLRLAIQRLDDSGKVAELAEMATQLRWFWYFTGRQFEGLYWYERVLELHPDVSGRTCIDALLFAGHLAEKLGRPNAAAMLGEVACMAHTSGDNLREAESTLNLAIMAENDGDYDEAEARFLIARELYARTSHAWRRVVIVYHLGAVTYGKGDSTRAARMVDAARLAAEAIGDQIVPGLCRSLLALIACEQDDSAGAVEHLRHLTKESSSVLLRDRSLTLRTASAVAGLLGDHQNAARLFGAAASEDAAPKRPGRAALDRAARSVRRQLGDDAWQHAWDVGRRMPIEEVQAEIALLLAGTSRPPVSVSVPEPLITDLTPRELEVLRQMANGLSNQQIADTLFNSRNTVANHVAHILSKLDVDSRTAAVSFAIRQQLI